jgi:thermitase
MRFRRLLVTAAALSPLLLPAATASAAATAPIVLKRAPGLTSAERANIRADAGVTFEKRLPIERVEVVSAPAGERAAAVAALRADPDVVWAEPDRPRSVATADELWPQLWGLENTGQTVQEIPGVEDADIDAPDAWKLTKGRGVTVGVVDTGVLATHPDLDVTNDGWDFVGDDAEPEDQFGHGTHVAGTISALENSVGVVGVAPRARVMPIRSLDRNGNGFASDVAAGFAYAGDHGARIVNASIGAPAASTVEFLAIRDHPDTLYVVAAGNLGRNNDRIPIYPCNYDLPNIVCVGATGPNDVAAPFSNRGVASVDFHAPGINILSTAFDGAYAYMNGTSMATPHASGVAALIAARAPALDALGIKKALLDGVDRLLLLNNFSATGGRLNAAGSLASLGPDADPPAAPSGLTATGDDGEVTLDWSDADEEDVAGYRVYAGPDAGPPVEETSSSAILLTGSAAGAETAYQVTAIDQAGNESERSAPASVRGSTTTPPGDPGTTPGPGDGGSPPPDTGGSPSPPAGGTSPPPPAPPADGLPAPDPPTAQGAAILHARVTGRIVVCRRRCHAHAGTLRFELRSAAQLRLTVARKACRHARCAYTTAGSRTLRLGAGAQAVRVGPRLAGVPLRPGAWRVTLATAAARASASFRVRSH